MDKLKEKLIAIFIVIFNLMFFLKIIKESFKIEEFDYSFMLLLMMLGVLVYLFYSFILEKTKYKIIFTSLLLGVIAILLYKYNNFIFNNFIKDFVDNILQINNALINEKPTYFYQYKKSFAVLIPILIFLLIALNNIWRNSIIVFNFIFMVSFWYLVFYDTILKNIYFFLAVSLVTFSINSFIKRVEEYKNREIKISINIKSVLILAIVASLIMVRIVSVLPQNYNGSNVAEVIDFFENKFSPGGENGNIENAIIGKYSLKQSGYSDTETKLGGPLTLDKKEVFKIKGDKPYYLKGSVKDYYSGNSWMSIDEIVNRKTKEYTLEKAGLKLASEGESDANLNVNKKVVEIIPSKNLNSTTFFVPNHSFDVDSDYKAVYYTTVPTFMSDIDIRDSYKVRYYTYDKYEDYVEDISDKPKDIAIEEEQYSLPLREVDNPYLNYKSEVLTSSRLSENDKIIISHILEKQSKYLQLNSKIQDRVYDLLREILQGTGKNINQLTNQEKALAIKNYLSKNYPYTLQVSEVPEGKDFVSYFLFEEKKGYCTYFASATTVLCRIAGIPARYVEGFKTPNNINSEGEYTVTNGEAHAWCEILINPSKDIWVVVDPSPTPTEFEKKNSASVENKGGEEEINEGASGNFTKPNKNKFGEEENWDDESYSRYNYELFRNIAIPFTIILYLVIKVFKVHKRKKHVVNSRSVIPLYQYYIDRLQSIYIIKDDSCADLEFIDTLKDGELKEKLRFLATLSYEEYYGGIINNDFNRKFYLDFIEIYTKNNDKKLKYILKKYLG